jgi:uncharacterized protein YrrD
MLIKSKDLKGYKLGAIDGEIGKIEEFYFDDKYWTIRYLVADTGSWMTGRAVLISPYALNWINKDGHMISTNLTKKQIELSPSLSNDQPVSKQFEETYYGYYNWPTYWTGNYTWGASHYISEADLKSRPSREKKWDSHLRSIHAVTGYHIQAQDGEMGRVIDFIIDDENWTIRYLVVETGHWFNQKKVLVSPTWMESVSWEESMIFTSLTQEQIRNSPDYSEQALLDRAGEEDLYQHYHREGYWHQPRRKAG